VTLDTKILTVTFLRFSGLAALVPLAMHAHAVDLAPLFNDRCVLQSGMPVNVWGHAQPGAKVTVSFDGQEKSASSDPKGRRPGERVERQPRHRANFHQTHSLNPSSHEQPSETSHLGGQDPRTSHDGRRRQRELAKKDSTAD
jgi:hypothetical protein